MTSPDNSLNIRTDDPDDYKIPDIRSKLSPKKLYRINPFHIAHPCNLQMLKARDNKKKNSRCDHSYEELLEKIQKFEE